MNSGMPANAFVVGFEYYKNALYAYTFPNSTLYKLTASTNWQAVYPVPLSNGIHRVRVIDTTLYVASYAAALQQYVYYLQNNTWQQMGNAFKNSGASQPPNLYDIISYNNEIYVCGEFNRVGTDTVSGIAKWNGIKWVPLGQGLSGKMAPNTAFLYPHNMVVYQNKLHVIGNFIKAGGITVNGIAAWDGTSWSSLGNGFNTIGYGLCEYNGELYSGGEFTQAGGTTVSTMAKWNGQTWIHPGLDLQYVNSPGNTPFVHTMEKINTTLYIGGGFNKVVKNGITYSCGSILSFNGATIDTMLGGVNKYVEGIVAIQNNILIGGNFNMVNNSTCQSVSSYADVSGIKEHYSVAPRCLVSTFCRDHVTLTGATSGLTYVLTDLSGKEMQYGEVSTTIPFTYLYDGCYILFLKERGITVQRNKIIVQH
ncbi:MAG: hypothetical protein QM534_01985 [Sediminibacterium sp.]|nr:hypothetical protein [Sediminibacterium sp.]